MIRLRGSLTPLSASVFKVKNLGAGRIPRSRGCLGNPTYHKYPRPPVFIPGILLVLISGLKPFDPKQLRTS